MIKTALLVQITRHHDGAGVLHCTRSDGSTTWQKQRFNQAVFFALHDLTHFAVQSVLGFRSAFFRLIADGWGIEETTGKSSRGPIPAEAVQNASGSFGCRTGEFRLLDGGRFQPAFGAMHLETAGFSGQRKLTENDLARIRRRRAECLPYRAAAWRDAGTDVRIFTTRLGPVCYDRLCEREFWA